MGSIVGSNILCINSNISVVKDLVLSNVSSIDIDDSTVINVVGCSILSGVLNVNRKSDISISSVSKTQLWTTNCVEGTFDKIVAPTELECFTVFESQLLYLQCEEGNNLNASLLVLMVIYLLFIIIEIF